MKKICTVFLFMLLAFNMFAQMGRNHGGKLNPDSLSSISVTGAVIKDSLNRNIFYLDVNNDSQPEYLLNFGPHWYEPDSSSAKRPDDGEEITVSGGLADNLHMGLQMIVVYEINGNFWRNPFDSHWNNMGYHYGGNGCSRNQFGWMHDSLSNITLNGIILTDTTFINETYYLDTDADGLPDYMLNFGPWWYQPASGIPRPNYGDSVVITGGKLIRSYMPMIIVYELNGEFWRDSDSLGSHLGGGWLHQNMYDSTRFHSPFDNNDCITFAPGWNNQMGSGHGHGGNMMSDSVFCQIFEIMPQNLPVPDGNVFAAYEINMFMNNGTNGMHHNNECGNHLHFSSHINFNFHFDDIQIAGFDKTSIQAKYWDNSTSSWINYNDAMVDPFTNTVSFNSYELSNYVILTAGQVTSVNSDNDVLPEKFALAQNYPNPFNPTTTIRYDLSQAAFVKLIVYNSLGEVVSTLVNESKDAGRYEALFNASGLSSGIYFYRIEAGNFVQTNKLILMK